MVIYTTNLLSNYKRMRDDKNRFTNVSGYSSLIIFKTIFDSKYNKNIYKEGKLY